MAPGWHPHLSAFSRGFRNSVGCPGPVDSQYGELAAAADRTRPPFPDLLKREAPGFRSKLRVVSGTFVKLLSHTFLLCLKLRHGNVVTIK